MELNLKDQKLSILDLCRTSIRPDRMEELLSWSLQANIFEAPASKRYQNKADVCCQRFLSVYEYAKDLTPSFQVSFENLLSITSRFHIVSNINLYEMKNYNRNMNGEFRSPFL